MAIIAYDNNRNYKKEIEELKALGQDATALEDARAAKITSADAASRAKWGLSADEIAQAEKRVQALNAPKQQTTQVQDFTADINALQEAQKAARAAALAKARDASVSALNAEQTTIAPQYYTKRNQEAATSELNRMNFAEYLAQRGGGSNTGASAQMEISRVEAMQGNIGALNQQEQAAQDDILRRKSAVENEYQWGVAQANSEVDAQMAAARIAEMQRTQELNLQQTNADRQYNLQVEAQNATLAAQTLDNEIKQYQLELMQNPNSVDNQIKATQLEQYKFELQQATELAKYAPLEAQARIEEIRASIRSADASIRASDASVSASRASVANSAIDNKGKLNQLIINVSWQTGKRLVTLQPTILVSHQVRFLHPV